jgi:hypothetical protein
MGWRGWVVGTWLGGGGDWASTLRDGDARGLYDPCTLHAYVSAKRLKRKAMIGTACVTGAASNGSRQCSGCLAFVERQRYGLRVIGVRDTAM